MKVGVVTASISRRAGGLFWAVRYLARCAQHAGCDVKVFSIVDEFSGKDASEWYGLDLRLLPCCGLEAFGYAPEFAHALDAHRLDLLHTHGLWMYPSLASLRWSRRWDRPVVVSPHGMLDPWAVRNSAWKKRLVGKLFEHAHLHRCACLHALCESEYRAIRSYGLSNSVAIIPNGVDLPALNYCYPQPEWATDLSSNCRVLLFLGRIHPKKGLVNLLHAWAQAGKQSPAISEIWHLVVAGWDQGGHREQLERLAEDLGVLGSVHFVGPQFKEQKAASLARAAAFILPSFSEGLPMAVLEAWSYCLPVLITPQCNLPEGFVVEAALDILPNVDSIRSALAKLFTLTDIERLAMGERGRELVEQRFTSPTIAAKMKEVYTWVLGAGSPPDCVIMD